MNTLSLSCTGHVLSVTGSSIFASGSVNVDLVAFTLDTNWSGYSVYALFYGTEREEPYEVALDENNRATVPTEVLNERASIQVGIYGVYDNTRITSTLVKFKVRNGAWDENSTTGTNTNTLLSQANIDAAVAQTLANANEASAAALSAESSRAAAATAQSGANSAKTAAEAARDAIKAFSVAAEAVTAGSSTPTVTKTVDQSTGAVTLTFGLVKGDKGDTGNTGATGATGNGIASISKTSTSGAVDTYTVTYTNGQTTTFTVTNGSVTSVAGQTGAVTLDADDVAYDDTATPASGSVGAGLAGLKSQITQLSSDVTALEAQTTEIVDLSEYVSGARGATGVIEANSKRCTTAKSIYLRPGDNIAVSDIDAGYRIVVAGATGGAYIVDSGWKTANYTYTVADGKAGTYYVNVSASSGTSDIDPANLSTLTVTATVTLQNRMANMDDETTDIQAVLGDYPPTTLNHTWVIGGIKVAGTNDSTTKRLRLTDYTLNVSRGTVISCDDIIDINVYEYSVDNTELLTHSDWTRKYATQNNAIIRIAVRLDSDHGHVMTSADLAEYPKHVYVGESTGLVAKVEQLESGDPDIASYYKTEGDATIQSVLDILTEPCLVFPLITDIHYQSDAPQIIDKSVENMRYVLESIPADFVLNLGDNSDGDHGDGTVTLKRADYVRDRLMSLGLPVYQAIGNHDTNYESSGTILTLAQCYRAYIASARDMTFNLATNGTDYYVDFDNLGIRLVVVNANYIAQYTFSTDTADWLTETALDTNKTVIFALHQSSINTQNYNAQSCTNGDGITAALTAFVGGGGKLIQLVGHGHSDYSFASPWLSIASCCNKCEKADITKAGYLAITGYDELGLVAPDRTPDTASMDCWSVVVVRPFARKINLVRFGAGSDREYSF